MPKSQKASFTVQESTRRRPTTACLTCRKRRVKCDRVHPSCSACKKGGHDCKYLSNLSRNIAFVPDLHCASNDTSSSAETWSDVFASRIERPSDNKKEPLFSCSPTKLVQKHDTEMLAFSYLSFKGLPLDKLGDTFVLSFRCRLLDCENSASMVEGYLQSCHCLVPICDMPSLKDIFALPWSQLVNQATAELMVLICAVLYAASSTSVEPSHACHAPAFLNLFKDLTRQLEFCDYFIASPSIPLLQGYIIFHTFRACHLAPFAAFGFLPQAIRFAQILRLHQDREELHRSERELRRRTWWHLIFLDVEASISNGLPNIIRPCDHDITLPSLAPGGTSLPGAAQDSEAVALSMQGHWLLAREIHKWENQQPTHDGILDFGNMIQSLISRIDGKSTSTWTKWARQFLRLQIYRIYCMAGLRLWQIDKFQSTSCQNDLVCIARSFLRSYLDLIQLGRDMALEWFIPGFIQPFYALMIILKHLSGCSDLECESSEKTYELITQVIDTRREWIMKGPIRPLPRKLMLSSESPFKDGTSVRQMTDRRYQSLWTLKEEVWRRFGWPATVTSVASITNSDKVSEYTSVVHNKTTMDDHDETGIGFTLLSLCNEGSHFPTATRGNSFETSDTPCNLHSQVFDALKSSNDGDTNISNENIHFNSLDYPGLPGLLPSVNWESWLIDFE